MSKSHIRQDAKCPHCDMMFRRIPIVGMIVCCTSDEQEEHITGYLAVPDEWIDDECFLKSLMKTNV